MIEIEKSKLIRIKTWFEIAKPIWLLLSIGLIFFTAEILLWYLGLRKAVASGGAVMVGVAVISQLYHSRLPAKEAIQKTGQLNLKRQRVQPNPNIWQTSEQQSKALNLLYKLSIKSDFTTRPENGESVLVLESVYYRVDKYVETAIVISTVLGTLIWAYGNEIFL